MNIDTKLKDFQAALMASIEKDIFIKATLGHYRGEQQALKSLYIKLILIKGKPMLSFVYRYQTKDITKNYEIEEALEQLQQLIAKKGFRVANLFSLEADWLLTISKKGVMTLHQKAASKIEIPTRAHDHQKQRKIQADEHKTYLQALKITDSEGKVYKNAQDKFKQINHYIEILSALLKALPERKLTHIVDMGAGKGYLTFALYDYLNTVLKKPAKITGVEFREDLVVLCNDIAKKSNFKHLYFEQGTIEKYENPNINVLIALHACDTATDEAIYKGIRSEADLIVVAPCCHKQIRREIEQNQVENELNFLTKYGIFLERQAEMITDGLRALILEYFGYTTKVLEFVSDAHTPKNVLIVGIKQKPIDAQKQQDILSQIQATKTTFGIQAHHLETLLELPTRLIFDKV
ncbi:MAG: SAM-dependent methyltransferase [Bernardetiaceae bacterium]|nr:SAM-dependent methyltransferase [Bernardetiaceae bacterium]